MDANGSGRLSDIIAGVDWVTQHSGTIEVASMSLGGVGYSDSLRLAIQACVAKGVVVVVAAGNAANDVYGSDGVAGTGDDMFPAWYPEVMAVSALCDTDGVLGGLGLPALLCSGITNSDDALACFSNYSLAATNSFVTSPGRAIDIAAPGVNIYSTYKNGSYATLSGTSMAAPHVSGAVALYCATYGRATNAAGVYAIRQALVNAGEPASGWGPLTTQNKPYIDFYPEPLLSVSNLGGPPSPYTNNAPAVVITSPTNGDTFSATNLVLFTGSSVDPEDGTISSGLAWYSSIDGLIGAGASFSKNISGGVHVITAKSLDSVNTLGTSNVTITVTAAVTNAPVVVSITVPTNGSSYSAGASITFAGVATNEVGGTVATNLIWTSSINGVLATNASFSKTNLSAGTHTITAATTNLLGGAVSDSHTVNIVQPQGTLVCTVSGLQSAYSFKDTVSFYVYAKTNGVGVPSASAAATIRLPNGGIVTKTGTTDSSGRAAMQYRVNRNSGVGTANITATVQKVSYTTGATNASFAIGQATP